jgi:hypothetical protein
MTCKEKDKPECAIVLYLALTDIFSLVAADAFRHRYMNKAMTTIERKMAVAARPTAAEIAIVVAWPGGI